MEVAAQESVFQQEVLKEHEQRTEKIIQEQKAEEDNKKGFLYSVISTANPSLRTILNQELQLPSILSDTSEEDENWRDKVEWDTWDIHDKVSTVYAKNAAEAEVMRLRSTEYRRAQKELADYNGLGVFGASIPVSLVSWTTGIPVLGVYKAAAHLGQTTGRIAATSGIGATAGFLTAKSEQYTGYNPDADTTTYTVMGALFGLGLEGTQRLFTNTVNKERLAKAFQAKNVEEHIDTNNWLIDKKEKLEMDISWAEKEGKSSIDLRQTLSRVNNEITNAQARLDTINNEFSQSGVITSKFFEYMPNFMKAPGVPLLNHDNPGARGMAQRIVASPLASRGKDGRYKPNPSIPGQVYKHSLTKHQTAFEMGMRAANTESKIGNFNKFSEAVQEAVYKAIRYQKQHGVLPKTFSEDPGIHKGVVAYENYYKSMLGEGQKLGVYGVKTVDGSLLYAPQIWNFQKIKETPEGTFLAKVEEALGEANNRLDAKEQVTPEEVLAKAKVVAQTLRSKSFDRESLDLGVGTILQGTPLGDRLKTRKIDLDQYIMKDYLVNDAFDSVGKYHFKQSGQYALNHSFPEIRGKNTTEAKDELLKLWDEATGAFDTPLKTPAHRKSDKQHFEAAIQDLLGTYRIPKNGDSVAWTAAKNMKSYNSLVDGANFIFNTTSELGGVVLGKGMKALFRTQWKTLSTIGKAVYNSDGTLNNKVAQEIMDTGLLTDIAHISAMSRHADLGEHFNVGNLEKTGNWLNSGMYKWTGMKSVTGMLEAMNAVGTVGKIRDLGLKKKLNNSDEAFLARLGFTPEDAKIFATKGEEVRDSLYKTNLEELPDEIVDKIQAAIILEAEASVPKYYSMYSPDIVANMQTDTGLIRTLALQYMAHPLTATSTMFMRGMAEDRAGLLMGATIGLGAMASTLYLKEQLAMALGIKDEAYAKYDLEDDEKFMNLIGDATGKNSVLGMIPSLLDYGAVLAGHEPIVSSSRYVPNNVVDMIGGRTMTQANNILTIMQHGAKGEFDSVESMRAYKSLMMGSSIYGIREYLDSQIKEHGVRY